MVIREGSPLALASPPNLVFTNNPLDLPSVDDTRFEGPRNPVPTLAGTKASEGETQHAAAKTRGSAHNSCLEVRPPCLR